jgi:hypothetical protein
MNSQFNKLLLSNKVVLVTFIVTLLWVMFDVNERFTGQVMKKQQKHEQVAILPLHNPSISDQTLAELKKSYQQYRQNETTKSTSSDILSAEQQAKQQGELKALYIGDNKLELKAIINSIVASKTQRLAMIKVTNVKTTQASLERFEHLDDVYGYQLAITNNRQVQLNNLSNKKQRITLSMYNRKK